MKNVKKKGQQTATAEAEEDKRHNRINLTTTRTTCDTKCFCLASFVICDYMCYRQSFLSAANERTRQYDGTKENSRINAQKYRLLIRYVLGRMTINGRSGTYLESIINF